MGSLRVVALGADAAEELEGRAGWPIELVAGTGDPEAAIVLCRARRPDAVLIGLGEDGFDGVVAIARLATGYPGSHMVALTPGDDHELVACALAAGACGFVRPGSASEVLAGALRLAAAGELVMPVDALPLVLDRLRQAGGGRHQQGSVLERLTRRETQILRALAAGASTSQVAVSLGITQQTVQSHVKNILAKLGVHSKIEAVTMAWRHGLEPLSRTA